MRKGILWIFAIASLSLFISCDKKETCNENKKVVIDNILNRRSVRSYKAKQIMQSELDAILKCGINAPNARNLQPWEIRVIQNKTILNELNLSFVSYAKENWAEMKDRVSAPDFNVIYNAPTFILIAYDTTNAYGQNDCGMLAQNMLLAAESMDIGTCVVGGIIRYLNSPSGNDFVQLLNLPENYMLTIGITAGYKNESPEAKPRDESKIQTIL